MRDFAEILGNASDHNINNLSFGWRKIRAGVFELEESFHFIQKLIDKRGVRITERRSLAFSMTAFNFEGNLLTGKRPRGFFSTLMIHY
jgi:hypothetical protein